MAVQFSEQALKRYERIVAQYPQKRAAIMATLWLAQKEFSWLSTDVMEYVAELMGLPLAWIAGVASFYTMFHKQPVGKHHLQVCTNVSCMLRGSDDILHCIEEHLGIRPGETTSDGKFSLEEVECLASCGTAPMMQVNEDYEENLDVKRTLELIERLARE